MGPLNASNYSKGFLIDEELLGGVSENKDTPGTYLAFVLRYSTGEYLGYREFPSLDEALQAINAVQREWTFEKSAGCEGCGDGSCGKGRGGCVVGKAKKAGAAEPGSCNSC